MISKIPSIEALDISPYRPGEEAAILDCMRVCFKFEPDMKPWHRLYLENPAGEPVIILARDGETVVSHVAFIPRRLRVFGQEMLAGGRIDSMTRPEWQRQGLQGALDSVARQLIRQRDFVMSYRFNNEQSIRGAIKHQHYQPIRPFPMMVRPLRPIRAGLIFAQKHMQPLFPGRASVQRDSDVPPDCAAAGPLPVDKAVSSPTFRPPPGWQTPAFDARHTRLFREAEALPSLAMMRDETHLSWRYPAIPEALYWQRDVLVKETLVATTVIRIASLYGLRFAFVMEWHWRDGAQRDAIRILREAVLFARSTGVHGITALAMPGTVQRRLLQRSGFFVIPELLFPKSLTLTVRCENEAHDAAYWFNSSNWYLTWGDGLNL